MIARVLPTASRAVQALVIAGLAAAALSLAPLHGEGWWQGLPSTGQAWMAGLLVAAYLGGSAVILGRSRRRAAAVADTAATGTPNADDWLVVHASQTGQAVEFAQRTVASLAAAGQRAQLRPIASVDAATLAAARRALFVASTTGEGDAPDPAAGFIRDTMRPGVALPGLRHAVLALGDRSYDNYCAFGHELDRWLRGAGAEPLFDLVEVDNGDPAALRHWQHHVGVAAGATGLPDWEPAAFGRWTLAARRRLNPGSAGGAVFEILLAPAPGEAVPPWRAGDIVEIGPRQAPAAVEALLAGSGLDPEARVHWNGRTTPLGDALAQSHLPASGALAGVGAQALADSLEPLPAREYSIASIPAEGHVRLLLRQMFRPDGSPGIGSGWLCDHSAPGDPIALRVRANPGFHGPDPDRPMLLVGNGTGIAGLRAHLAERIAAGGRRNWALFGERYAHCDLHQREDILRWLDAGDLERLDLAFSRGVEGAGLPATGAAADRAAVHRGYVQDALRAEAPRLRRWIEDGASILVCGSLQGMAPGVDAALRAILGDGRVDDLLADGRYRRDVY